MHASTSKHDYAALESLLNYLECNYYERIEGFCKQAEKQLANLQQEAASDEVGLYVSMSLKLTDQVAQYMRLRRYALLPYIRELFTKKTTGHDCRSCTGSCKVGHGAHIFNIRDSHRKVKERLFRLHSIAKPLYETTTQNLISYPVLRAGLMQLDTALTELFYLEESSLIPKVLEAQEAIHAHS